MITGAGRDSAGCARRSPGETPKDPGSIPGTSSSNSQGVPLIRCEFWLSLVHLDASHRRRPDANSGARSRGSYGTDALLPYRAEGGRCRPGIRGTHNHARSCPGVHARSPGLGDPYFPLAGNGGYDVGHYALDFSYDPSTRQLDGTATISATATQDLSLRPSTCAFDVESLVSAACRQRFARDGQELVITPAAGLVAGTAFTVVVGYQGVPSVVTDPDGSIEGWVPTADGAFVVGEPRGRQPGIRPTTTLGTRRRTTSRSPCPPT